MNPRNKIELLSPAKNADIGIQAILHGADAVYIGGPAFGARAAAGNSIEDIDRLVDFAHTYYAKVYVALNTILTDSELEKSQKIIWQLYSAGVDALIIQDMGITQLDLPPISLHASTQMDNRTWQKVKFLQDVGFDQVVLARELSFGEISEISSKTDVRLEAFIHGALCVSYSGQCYLSHAACGRSANRGECAQMCRLPYELVDADGRLVSAEKHLLSLKDMNQSEQIRSLLSAGVSSLKIEGRLKDVDYVKNVTASYRKILDEILESDNGYTRSSSGKSVFLFQPDLNKSFNRGFTTYFTNGRCDISSFDTPKSQGEYFGVVKSVKRDFIEVATDKKMANGDGFCFVDSKGNFCGFKANRVDGCKIYPLKMPSLTQGCELRRNMDSDFVKILEKESAQRRIGVNISVSTVAGGVGFVATDEDGNQVSLNFSCEQQLANDAQKNLANFQTQMSKLGNTPFVLNKLDIPSDFCLFVPSSFLSDWRRKIVEALTECRESNRPKDNRVFQNTQVPFLTDKLDFFFNVYNSKAEAFYRQHGATSVDRAFESGSVRGEVALMTCRHCIRYSLGICKKSVKTEFKEPFYLVNKQGPRFKLVFDCSKCQMLVVGSSKK